MCKLLCPCCEEPIKENGVYLKQYVNYEWCKEDKKFKIDAIEYGELLTTCCDAEVDDEVTLEHISNYYNE